MKFFIEHLLTPIIVGIVVLIGQFFIQPAISRKTEINVEQWRDQKEAFLQALNLIDQDFDSRTLFGDLNDLSSEIKCRELSQPPSSKERNAVGVKLLLTANNPNIVQEFYALIDSGASSTFTQRADFIKNVREELFRTHIDVPSSKFPFWVTTGCSQDAD